MLTQKEIVPYLLRRELIRPASIVEGDLVVRDVSRRNRNYKVISERGPSYLVKQGIGEEGRATVAHEATVYQLLHARAGREGLDRYVPRCYGYDAEEHVLVLELLRDAESLREYHARRGYFSVRAAAAIGDGLGAFHGVTKTEAQRAESPSPFPNRRPWALSLHRPDLSIFRSTSSGNIQLIKIIQQFPEFCGILEGLNREWRAESLIHFDVKADNFVLFTPPEARRRSRLKIIDWELAGRGDPCWDAGSVFSDYLSFWLFSMPVTGETPPERFMELARYPLAKMQPAMRAFWQAYVRRLGLNATDAQERLLRSVQYGAARLVQTGFEQMQMAHKPTGNTICMLQLSLNIMRRPQEASARLLGIPIADGRA